MSYFGIILMVWLLVGFFVGLKAVWVEDRLNADMVKKNRETMEKEDNEQLLHLYDVFTKKGNFLALCTLMGFIVGILEVRRTIKKIKIFFSKDKKEAK